MARPRRPKKPVPCSGTWSWNGEIFACLQMVRSPADVIAAMVAFPAETRAMGVRYWSERARLDAGGMVPWEDRDDADGTRWIGYRVDVDLPAFALELTARLCPGCACKEAERQANLRKLVFIGCLRCPSSGQDERAPEEWELLRVPGEPAPASSARLEAMLRRSEPFVREAAAIGRSLTGLSDADLNTRVK